ncbi:MAG: amino acid permease [Bellilinea sp.]|nr:MAG: amino acid permease [Bellilinea sp.]
MNIEDQTGTTVLRRETEAKPKKSWRTWLIGRPLPTADAPHQTIGVLIGLAVFASDALSSTAYATQEMLVILMVLGPQAYQYVFPLAIAIVILLGIVTLSYEQTVHAYPNGGGAYIVTRDNIGALPSKIAAAALLTDYILTVAVSISSGVAQIVSAIPSLFEYRVGIAVGLVAFIMVVNLRGIKESGKTFAIPTYFFIITMFVTVLVGLGRYLFGTLGVVTDPPPLEILHTTYGVGAFLILRAFASGTAALTGIEAIADGIPAFREPRSKNAGTTLIIMSLILGSLMLSISFLSAHIQAVPSEAETVISQLARTAFNGRGGLYGAVIIATTVILIMAANTSFADFPRLSAITATDGLLPRQLTYRGSRLVYSRGIVLLALLATLLIVVFQASVTRLIPLYAVGVFLSFTLSQAGMAHRWWKIGKLKEGQELRERGSVLRYDPNWLLKMVINGFGAFCTGVVMIVFAATKFVDGAWVVIVIIPTLVVIFSGIQRHYHHLAAKLSLENYGGLPQIGRHRVIIPIGGVHRGTLAALRYARTLSDDITAVHVSLDPQEADRVRQKWETWGDGRRLVILESPYRLFIEPLLEYINEIEALRQPNEIITIVVPEFVPRHWWASLLHTQTALTLRMALLFHKDIVITSVPYQVD